MVGDGAEKKALVAEAESSGISNVVFHDTVAKEDMPAVWSVCDVALVHLKDNPVFATVIPSKIFEAFGMGKPVLAVQPRGEAVEIVEAAGAGGWAPPEDPQALADEVAEWRGNPERLAEFGRNAALAADANSRDRLALTPTPATGWPMRCCRSSPGWRPAEPDEPIAL
jgi:glycosyltransferase involved in cell wall biosynthesis